MSESDGIEEAFEGQVRVALLVAGRVAEELARQRERAAREAEQQSVQAARDLAARVAAERTTARASLAPIERDAWWERATPRDIEAAWQTAQQWQDVEPDARRATETIREQVRTRYGIDVDALDPDRQDAVSRAMDDRARQEREAAERAGRDGDRARSEADQERVVATLLAGEAADERAAADDLSGEQGGEVPLLERADSAEQEAGQRGQDGAAADSRAAGADAERSAALGAAGRAESASGTARAQGPAYDSHERRAQTQSRLEGKLGPEHAEAIEARMAADTANARPASDIAHEQAPAAQAAGRRRLPFGKARAKSQGIER
ncbi:hypothetical protein WDV85_16685 [Pseudokineococcus sp. 5B2Z-1]|uniref:hypothetical protein n=1 Tax=Pseudokineococcus sp. 5B2Z-1 TaxID=3132744 RepID=UPI0030B16E08